MLVARHSSVTLENGRGHNQLVSDTEGLAKGMDLRDAVRLLQRRWRLIAAITVACSFLAVLSALLMTPQYRAVTQIMLDSRRTNVIDLGSVVSGLPMDNVAVRSEMDIISSRAVIDRVIDKLNLMSDEEFSGYGLLSKINPFGASESDEDISRKRTIVASNVGKRLNVTNDGRSFGIGISFDSKDPKKASAIANAFVSEYLVDQLEAKYEATARANKWIEERLGNLKAKVEESENTVEEFRRKSGLIEIDGSTVAARQMQEINRQLTDARVGTSQAEAKLRSIQGMIHSKGGLEGAADVLASPLIQRLREQETEVRRREAEMASRYGEMHPKMINTRAEYRDLQNKISEEVRKIVQSMENEVEIARAKERQIEKDLHNLESRAGVEMKDSVALRQLQREADSNRTLYENFLTRFKETGEQQEMKVADARIIAPADAPVKPAFPNKLLFMLVGLIIGSVLGVMAAYLVEYFDRGFRRSDGVEEATGLPVIGMIPSLAGVSDLQPEGYVISKPLSAYSESLRTVRTAIHFSNVDNPPKTVMVTSSGPAEGKTAFCMSLARSVAKAGNKVLLIDADLRKPRIAQALGIKETNGGLAAVLAGDKNLKDALRPDKEIPNLHILPASGTAPNSQDMLGSQHMLELLQDVSKRYDLIILDTPPILAVADAAMVSHAVDTTIFLIKWSETPRETVMRALKQLGSLGCHIAGIVLSQVDTVEHAKYGDGYYHRGYHEYYHN